MLAYSEYIGYTFCRACLAPCRQTSSHLSYGCFVYPGSESGFLSVCRGISCFQPEIWNDSCTFFGEEEIGIGSWNETDSGNAASSRDFLSVTWSFNPVHAPYLM